MKKLLVRSSWFVAHGVVIFSLLTAFMLPTAYAADVVLSLSPSTGTFNKGCPFTIAVNLDTGGVETSGTDLILFYDPTRFTAQAIREGTIYGDYSGNFIDPASGRIGISGLSSAGSSFSGSGVLASVDFVVVEDAPAGTSQIKFDFDPGEIGKTTDSNVVEKGAVVDILSRVTNGNYIIGSGACGTSGSGSTATSSGTVSAKKPVGQPLPTKAPVLPTSGAAETTVLVGVVGVMLAVLGLLGLALL